MTQTITIPASVSADEARFFLAIKLYEVGKLSCGQAAELSGYSKPTFVELLAKHGVIVLDHPADELPRDLSNA